MTTTPTQWSTAVQVNTASLGIEGGDQKVVGLSNSNFLIVYSDDSGSVGAGAGVDITGVIYDAVGNIVASAFQLNSAATADDEEFPSIAATNDGGFVMAYESDDGSQPFNDLLLERYDASGTSINSVVVQAEPGPSDPTFAYASVAVNKTDNSIFVSFRVDDGTTDEVNGKRYDADLNLAAGTPADGHQIRHDDRPATLTEGVFENETAVLSNGNFVTVFTEDDTFNSATDEGIEFRISDGTTGANIGAAINVSGTGANGRTDNNPQVAGLVGGGFVVVWREIVSGSDNILFARYDNDGSSLGSVRALDNTRTYRQPDVVALEDGGFFIASTDVETNTVFGARYSSTGILVGSRFELIPPTNSPSDPELSLTSDGRILVVWEGAGGDIFSEIWDPRETTINADPGDTQITARVDEDTTINGTEGDETFHGLGGDDTIRPGTGADDVRGGAGVDTVDYGTVTPGSATETWDINLTTGFAIRSDGGGVIETDMLSSIENARAADASTTLTGTSGANQLFGGAANDTVIGGSGDDDIFGGDGDDVLIGGTGVDTVSGNDGDDTIVINNLDFVDFVAGGSGIDTLDASDEQFTAITADIPNFALTGNGGTQFLIDIERFIGTQLADTLIGGGDAETLIGENGDDTLAGNGGDDEFEGGAGADSISGGAGRDTVSYAGSSEGVVADLLIVGPQTNDAVGDTFDSIEVMIGTGFNDWLRGRAFAETLSGTDGNDTLSGRGSADLLEGGAGNDALIGGGGPDVMNGGAGRDFIRGDAGTDRIIFVDATAGVTADLVDQSVNTGEASGDTYIDIEDADGTSFDDDLRGEGGTNVLRGRDGDDTLRGRGGDDTLEGGRGEDLLLGGNGADRFYYTGASQGGDTITDFVSGTDVIAVLGAAFGGLPAGPLAASSFGLGSAAQDGDDFFIYDPFEHELYYDADGNGAGEQVLLARFTNAPLLSASDIIVV